MSDNPMLPNSFSTPNIYVDEIMYLLTSEEYMVLSYACRRIYGFQKREDHISLSQFTDGTTSKATKQKLDHGTGLNKMTVQRAVNSLKQFGLLIEIAPPDKARNIAAHYKLQEDVKQVDFDGLETRYNERHKDRNAGKRPGKKAKDAEGDMNPMLSHSIGDDDNNKPMLSHSTGGMLSNSRGPMLSHSITKDRGNTEETQYLPIAPASDKVITFTKGHNPLSDEVITFREIWANYYESKPPSPKWIDTHVAIFGMKKLAVAMYKSGGKDGLNYIVAIARGLTNIIELEAHENDGYPKPKPQPIRRDRGNGRGSHVVSDGNRTPSKREEFERLHSTPAEKQPNGGKYDFNKPRAALVSG